MTSWSRFSAKLCCTAKRSYKFEKPQQLPFSISEATARNVCYPESWAYIRSVRRKPSQYVHYNTAKCLKSPTNPASDNFWWGHIEKFKGCTFIGDQSKIARLNENWSLRDRGTCSKAGLWTVIFVPFGLETSDIRSWLNAWARAWKKIKLFMFLFLCFIVWPYNKHLINRAKSVSMGESWSRSLVQTSLCSVCTGGLGQDLPIQTSC